MFESKKYLIIKQTETKLNEFRNLKNFIQPNKGWINTIRTALNMSLRQLGKKLNTTAQNIKQIEDREASGTITINTLKEVANELDMKLVYGFISKHDSLEQMIEKRAKEIATEIVLRTNTTMILEDQQNTSERIKEAIEQKTTEIKYQLPKFLWD